MRKAIVILCLFFAGCASSRNAGTPRPEAREYIDVSQTRYSKVDPPNPQQIAKLRELFEQMEPQRSKAGLVVSFGHANGGYTVNVSLEDRVREHGRTMKMPDNSALGYSVNLYPGGLRFLLYLPTNSVFADHGNHRDEINHWDVANMILIAQISADALARSRKNSPVLDEDVMQRLDLLKGWANQWNDHTRRIQMLRQSEIYRPIWLR